jgi:hypothetical protein
MSARDKPRGSDLSDAIAVAEQTVLWRDSQVRRHAEALHTGLRSRMSATVAAGAVAVVVLTTLGALWRAARRRSANPTKLADRAPRAARSETPSAGGRSAPRLATLALVLLESRWPVQLLNLWKARRAAKAGTPRRRSVH